MRLPRLLPAAVLALPLAACAAPGGTFLAERSAEPVPLPPVEEGTTDDGVLANLARQATLEEALDNETRGWRNPRTGGLGTVTPLRSASGCRDYRETVLQDGREATRTGTACRNAQGMWVVTKE